MFNAILFYLILFYSFFFFPLKHRRIFFTGSACSLVQSTTVYSHFFGTTDLEALKQEIHYKTLSGSLTLLYHSVHMVAISYIDT